jgi:3-mercaptopyruvate sulfurtransferase SseA
VRYGLFYLLSSLPIPRPELNQVRQLGATQVQMLTATSPGPIILDVREPDEYTGELGHIAGSLLIPLKDLTARAEELDKYKDSHIIAAWISFISSACERVSTSRYSDHPK